MLIRVTPGSPTPIFQQIIEQLRTLIAQGELGPGTKLPSGRALAATLDVNMHTVLRAYQELRDDGWVEMRRGRGVRVVGPQSLSQELEAAVLGLVQLAKQTRVEKSTLLDMISKHYGSNHEE